MEYYEQKGKTPPHTLLERFDRVPNPSPTFKKVTASAILRPKGHFPTPDVGTTTCAIHTIIEERKNKGGVCQGSVM
jgi:ribosomal protein L1